MSIKFKFPPYKHQLDEFELSKDRRIRGLFWEMGCGKSKAIIDQAAHMHAEGAIDGILVVAPNNVHRNWVTDELPRHMPDEQAEDMKAIYYQSARYGTKSHKQAVESVVKHAGLAVLTVNHEAFSTDKGKDLVWAFLKRRKGRTLYVVDESHRIKTPSAKRAQSVVKSGKFAEFKRILTGTPVANRPFDVYMQMRFLDPSFWVKHRLPKFSVFKSRFGIWQEGFNGRTGQSFKTLSAYQNLEELNQILSDDTSRLLKEDVLDLPPKVYKQITFQLSKEHRKAYDQLAAECLMALDSGEEVTVTMALTMLLRLQQVSSGYVGTDEGAQLVLPGKNARLATLVETLEDVPHQAIIWCRFQQDINDVTKELGDRCVRYDGVTSDADRAAAIEKFRSGDVQFFVGNPAAGGTGITLTEAKTVIYYSNSFNLVDRLQSEDRAHRIGQDSSVLYIDLVAEDTVDSDILGTLMAKSDTAAVVTGDKLRKWLR